MSDVDLSKLNQCLLPYDFVRSKQLAAFQNGDECTVITPNGINLDIYHELSRFLEKAFVIKQCSLDEFDDLITKVFSSDHASGVLSEELSDEFDLASFANTIAPTEDLLSGSDDAPIIKLINGIISQAIKERASDIHFETYQDKFVVRFRIDGILRKILTQDSRIAPNYNF
jgi:Type II secretory pathway, ATPase PulE/Tfp pilus assembly pathway, ATPase PilB